MKLVIQIPCLNEAETLPITLADLPSRIPGIDQIEVLVIDDSSTDGTSEVARSKDVDHILRFPTHQGLAQAFAAGLDTALKLGADIIVHTDADNQYPGSQIPQLIEPILLGKADMVIGDRQIGKNHHVTALHKLLQRVGSWMVRQLSNADVPDAPSGFRALSRQAALKLNIITDFSYTLETIIQAGKHQIAVTHIPIRTNPPIRESRLFANSWTYVKRSVITILRIYAIYEPLKVFSLIGGMIFSGGFFLGLRFLYYYMVQGGEAGHVQSLILGAVLMIIGFQICVIGLLADLLGANRKLIENLLLRVKGLELSHHYTREQELGQDGIHVMQTRR